MGQQPVYKICPAAAWHKAQAAGAYAGSPDDLRDGFIHLSTIEQLPGTAAKHFAGQSGLVLLTVDLSGIGAALKWEPSRGGALFPHLYAELPVAAIIAVHQLPLGEDGMIAIPEGLS